MDGNDSKKMTTPPPWWKIIFTVMRIRIQELKNIKNVKKEKFFIKIAKNLNIFFNQTVIFFNLLKFPVR